MDTETGDGGRASGNCDPRRDQSPPHAGVALTRLGSPDREHIHVPQSAPYAGPLHPRRGVGAGDIQFSHTVRVSFFLSTPARPPLVFSPCCGLRVAERAERVGKNRENITTPSWPATTAITRPGTGATPPRTPAPRAGSPGAAAVEPPMPRSTGLRARRAAAAPRTGF